MTEEKLVGIARKLGEEAAARLDVENTARAVIERLRAQERKPHRWMPRVLQAAAVAVLAVGVGLFTLGGNGAEAFSHTVVELADLEYDQLVEIGDSLSVDSPIEETLGAGLYDLSENELNELLQLMEG